MKPIAIFLLICAVTVHCDPAADFIWVSEHEVKCSVFKPEYRFYEGCQGELGRPPEAFMRLVAVRGESKYLLNTRTGLVGFVAITNKQQALDFVRLFSRKETHYLFDDADFLELPKYTKGSSFWNHAESARRARNSGIPIDAQTVDVAETNGAYRITRYAMDWNLNILKVVETVAANGVYTIVDRQVMARDIWADMPLYK